MTIDEARALFHPEPGIAYLDTATYGLPPQPTVEAMHEAIRAWQAGTADWVPDWDRCGDVSRDLFANLIGAQPDEIALVPTVSVGMAAIAASLTADDHVLVPEGEFTSVLFPLLVAQQERGFAITQVPFDRVADSIDRETTLVATSLVRSQDGRMANLPAICAATDAVGARLLIDATHAIPFVPVNQYLGQINFVVCHGYKHLLCPRGAGFLYIQRDRWDQLPPVLANWRATDAPHHRSYGGPLTLAPNAARFDVSLDWFAWVGAARSLQLLVEWQQQDLWTIPLRLAADLADQLGLHRPASSIVAVPVDQPAAVLAQLRSAGIRAAAPAGVIRLSTHVYTTADDIERAATMLAPLVRRAED